MRSAVPFVMGQVMHTYRHSGLTVASELALPEWEGFACASGKADVRILYGKGNREWPPEDEVAVHDGTLRFAIDGVGGWEVAGGHTIRIFPEPRAGETELRLFTLGSAWGALGIQRGLAFWHGSAVTRGGRTIFICGPQGAGKSTLAAALVGRGWALLADDLARIEPREDGALLHPSSQRSKLWSDAVAYLDLSERVLHRDYFRADKFHCGMQAAAHDKTTLTAIILLGEGDAPRIERLSGADAMTEAFTASLYRPQYVEALAAWLAQTVLAARICATTPVYRLLRPHALDRLDESCALIDGL